MPAMPGVVAIAVTTDNLSRAFAEWERRYREEPERFASDAERLGMTPENYGDAATRYLVEILGEAS
jgi:hypothetical protein